MIEIEINKENLLEFISNIRIEDKKELEYFIKNDLNNKFIDICLKNSEKSYFLALNDLTPVAIGGVCDCCQFENKVGQIWLLCANGFDKEKKFLYKYVKNKIKSFDINYDVLFNYIYKTNFSALKWLNKVGFSYCNTDNSDFRLFYKIKKGVCFDIRCFTCK